jgi:translocator protein
MAVAVWLVWREYGFRRGRNAIALFVVQLAANAVWTWIFFAWQQGAAAFVEILFLWCLIVATITSFWRLRVLAGLMLVPYLVWVSFAAVLTFSTWKLNPAVL